jgi:hypothetical protein
MQLELLSPVRVPEKGTQCFELLSAMREGKRLTIWNAMQEYGCGALHQRMKDLRDLGWPIQRRIVKTQGGANVAEFWL